MTVNHDVAGSNPASGASGLFVKRLRHRPFTAGSGVRIPHRSPWAISSAGRASALQAECQQFDPVIAHHNEKFHVLRAVGFFIAISLPPYLSFNLLHPRSRSFARRFAPSNDVRCGTSSILFSPTKKKTSCDLLHGVFFLAFSLFSLRSCNLLHPHSRSFARRFAPSNDVRCGTSSILFSPAIMKSPTCSAPWDFLLPFPFSLICHSPCP